MVASGFEDFFYTSSDGLRLHARVYGDRLSDALPAVCLPGLTRNAADFHDLALRLARDPRTPRPVVAFDYRGRGRSAHDRNWRNYDVVVETGDVIAGLAALGIGHAAFIGTSRGGLIVHAMGAMRPALMKAVVLNDVGPVIEGAGLAQIRAYLDGAPKPKDFADAAAIMRTAQRGDFPALSDADWERMARAFYAEGKRGPAPLYDPALLNTLKAVYLNAPLPTFWPQFEGLTGVPLLAIRGENSRLLSAATLADMARRHPRMEAVTVAGQGHAPLLETGDLPERIAAFIARADLG